MSVEVDVHEGETWISIAMFYFSKASTSLRARLVLIPAGLSLLGIVVAVGVSLIGAPERVTAETASGFQIGSHLINYALDEIRLSTDPTIGLDRLKTELSHVRHIRVGYRPASNAPITELRTPGSTRAPSWFVDSFKPHRVTEVFPVFTRGEEHGELVISTEAGDEGAELWDELIFLVGLLSSVSLATILLTWLAVNYTLKPLQELVDGLIRLGRGQFHEVGQICVAELQSIGDQFNQLARSLARTEADNRLLVDRLMYIQEAEREELARELHDEFGASLFGIRASASFVLQVACSDAPPDARFRKIAERATAISQLADTIQQHNYRILERIRPIALNESTLGDALRNLVEEWVAGHPGQSCEIHIPDDLPDCGDEASLTIYRIVQECLTNIARHSEASHVQISIGTSADRHMTIRVADNGIGLPAGVRFGFGFLGMSERARKLGGSLQVANGPNGGAVIEIQIPLSHFENAEIA
jgi:two-component system, NarL family, sensor histidine kinase UhpB